MPVHTMIGLDPRDIGVEVWDIVVLLQSYELLQLSTNDYRIVNGLRRYLIRGFQSCLT